MAHVLLGQHDVLKKQLRFECLYMKHAFSSLAILSATMWCFIHHLLYREYIACPFPEYI